MAITYSNLLVWTRRVATTFAGFVIATITGGFILQLCEDANWYKRPWATVTKLIELTHSIFASATFHWVGGIAVGFAVGIWLDDSLRRLAAKSLLNSRPAPEKGFLDYHIDLEKSGREMTKTLQAAAKETSQLGIDISKQTLRVQKVTSKIASSTSEKVAREARDVANSSAKIFDAYCKQMAERGRALSQRINSIVTAVDWLSSNQSGWVNEKTLGEMLALKTGCVNAKAGLIGFSASLDGSRKVAANLNAAIDRTQDQIKTFLIPIDHLTALCDRVLGQKN